MESDQLADQTQDDYSDFQRDMIALIPSLRAFARGLCRNRDLADDLVQEAMMRAWGARDRFEPGTNFRAWMFTILRNEFFTAMRKSKRETSLDPQHAEAALVQQATQEGALHLEDVDRAMAMLPAHQAEVIWLIAGAGLSYDETASVVGCTTGTVKSRLSRAREAIKVIMERAPDIAPSPAAIAS